MSRSAEITVKIGLNEYKLHSGSRILPEVLLMEVGQTYLIEGGAVVEFFNDHWADFVKAVGLEVAAFIVGQSDNENSRAHNSLSHNYSQMEYDAMEAELCRDLQVEVKYFD